MQVAFVAYHYATALGFYVSIRWLKCPSCSWRASKNATYFLNKDDFSLARFLKMVWRIQFLRRFPVTSHWHKMDRLLRRRLAYVHFVLCFVFFGFSKLILRHEEPGSLLRIVFALVYYL